MVGGLIYTYGGYSTGYQIEPVPRFSLLIAFNATTGNVAWTLNAGIMPGAAANGYITGLSQYDGQMYCIGKGTTATSVTAQQQVGGSVVIQGSVLDTSAGSSSATLKAMFPYGVPAISDANMSVWMDYLYMQNATLLNAPPDCTGVPVTLTAVSSTGTTVNLGTVTSDSDGQFAYQWTPTTAGFYTVYATFAGTNAYFESYGETAASVAITSASATATPTPTVTPTSTSTASNVNTNTLAMYLIIVAIAIIIAIAVVGLLILRKKP